MLHDYAEWTAPDHVAENEIMVTRPVDIQQNLMSTKLTGLARFLVRHQLLDEETALKATETAQRNKTSLVTHIVQNKLASSYDVARIAAK